MYEPKVLELTFKDPADTQAALAKEYLDGWRLIAVTNFMGRNWYYLERPVK